MGKKKKLKLEIPDSALKDIPEDEREEVKKAIEEIFEGVEDPTDVQAMGQPVEWIENTKECPKCGGALQCGPTFTMPDSGDVVQIFFCANCDHDFMGVPLN